ncbi:retrovirus-related pol polyprotein from transposon TNT 1-94 [Tanacetum coccineum]
MEQQIKILENDFKRAEAQYINLDLKMQHQKEKMTCDVSWKSMMTKLSNENVLLKTQVESVVQERENIKLEFQKLFNSIKATRNQDLLITICKLKAKLKLAEKGKNAKIVSKDEIKTNKSKPVTSCSTPTNEKVASYKSVRRPESKDTTSKKRVLLNTNSKSTSKDVKKYQSSFTSISNKNDTMNLNVSESKANVLKAKTINDVHDGSNLVCVSCGKDVFLIAHDKCVSHYALSPNSRVKRALFTSPVDAKSSKLGATPVVVKSRFSVATPPKATNKVIQLVLWIIDSWCSKHMTGNLKLLRNFVEKFMGTVRFSNDHFTTITGYGDYVQEGEDLLTGSRDSNLYTISISNLMASSPVCLMSKATSTKSWYFFLRTKDEVPDMIINFINKIQWNMQAQVLKVRSDNGTEFKNDKLRRFYEKLVIIHHTSIARTPQQNGVVERRNRTLVEAARTMLIFSKYPKFLWAKAIATACFTQNRSIVHTRYNKLLMS